MPNTKTMQTDLALPTLFPASPEEFADIVLSNLRSKKALCGWGLYGVGKSQIAKRIGTSLGMAVAELRLAEMDFTDVRGQPYQDTVLGIKGVSWAVPTFLPRDLDVDHVVEINYRTSKPIDFSKLNPIGKNKIHYVQNPHIIVEALDQGKVARIVHQTLTSCEIALLEAGPDGEALEPPVNVTGNVRLRITGKAKVFVIWEEINLADEQSLAACYSLILDGYVGYFVMPDECYQLALCNPPNSTNLARPMPGPLANRFRHVAVETSLESFLKYAGEANFHPWVIEFHQKNPNMLIDDDETERSGSVAIARPRTWEDVSDWLKTNPDASDDLVRYNVTGSVGMQKGLAFCSFIKIESKIPSAADILAGRVRKMEIKQKDAQQRVEYAVVMALGYTMQRVANDMKRANPNWMETNRGVPSHAALKHYYDMGENLIRFVLDNTKPETQVWALRFVINQCDVSFDQKSPSFKEFSNRHKSALTGMHSKIAPASRSAPPSI